jgi:hypothetical protein
MLVGGGCATQRVVTVRQCLPFISTTERPETYQVECVIRALALASESPKESVAIYKRFEFQSQTDGKVYVLQDALLQPGFAVGDNVIVIFTKTGYIWDIKKKA